MNRVWRSDLLSVIATFNGYYDFPLRMWFCPDSCRKVEGVFS